MSISSFFYSKKYTINKRINLKLKIYLIKFLFSAQSLAKRRRGRRGRGHDGPALQQPEQQLHGQQPDRLAPGGKLGRGQQRGGPSESG